MDYLWVILQYHKRVILILQLYVFGVNINKCTAWFAGTGDEPINVTLLEDVAKFVAASLDLDEWQVHSGVIGSRTSWNEIVRLGEKVRGKKFDVKRQISIESLVVESLEDRRTISNNIYYPFRMKFIEKTYEFLVEREVEREKWINKIQKAKENFHQQTLIPNRKKEKRPKNN